MIFSRWNLRIFNSIDSPLTVLADSPLKMLLLAALIFGMRCIHCLTFEYWDVLPAEWLRSTLVLELVKGHGATWSWLKMGRGPNWVVILLKSEWYFTHQPSWRKQGFKMITSATMTPVTNLQMRICSKSPNFAEIALTNVLINFLQIWLFGVNVRVCQDHEKIHWLKWGLGEKN